jgi:hypothetical protein
MVQDDTPEEFACPNCQAYYKVVRVKAEPGKTYRSVHCRTCHTPLPPTDGDDILKYFLVRQPSRS